MDIPKGYVACKLNFERTLEYGLKGAIHCEDCIKTDCVNFKGDKEMDRDLLERLVEAFEGINNSLDIISKGVTYRDDSDCPSISESMVKIAEGLSK